MKQIRIFVADGRALVRGGICALLEEIPEVQIVGEAGDCDEALRLIKQHQPDIALIEDAMSRLNAFELTTRVSKEYSDVHIIILSTHPDERYLQEALSSGAAGYLAMTASAGELKLAVRDVASGETHVSPSATRSLVALVRNGALNEPFKPLTQRQREVLRLIAEGYSTKQIALDLNISVKTVETHRTLLTARLDIHSTAGLVRYAIRHGFVGLEDSRVASM